MKTCKLCGIEKPVEEFYKHRGERDGRMRYCIVCTKAYRRNHRGVGQLPQSDQGRRVIAHRLAAKAKKCKLLIDKPCEICGNSKLVQMHHHDYDKPYDVNWLCLTHHAKVSRILKIVRDVDEIQSQLQN